MKKQLRSALIASAALMMLAIPPSWAAQGYCNNDQSNHGQDKKTCPNEGPEINVGAGGARLTVLAIDDRQAASGPTRQWTKSHPSWVTFNDDQSPNPNAYEHFKKRPHHHQFDAPEIDVGAGGAGLTVLAIALLLAAERRARASQEFS